MDIIDTEEIIASIANLDLNQINSPEITEPKMTLPNIEIRPLDLIPDFDGTPHKLYRFITLADETLTQYWDNENLESVRNRYIFNCIVSKLTGRAEEIISISGANTWPLIKTTLLNTFGDQRDENALLSDLIQLRQKPNEEPITYYYRIISTLNHLTNYINLYEKNAAVMQNKIVTYANQALRTLIVGLKEPIQSMIRSLKPTNLADALKYLTEDANIRYMSKQNNQYQNTKPIFKTPVQNSNFYRQVLPVRSPFHQQYSFPSTSQFPRGPVNVQPRNLPPHRYPTNSQVFGKNQNVNVWKSRPNTNNQTNTPTPMSVNTRNTTQNQNFRTNLQPTFQPNFQQRPRYTFEELHNFENPDDYQTQENPYFDDYFTQAPYEEQTSENFFDNNYAIQDSDQQNEQTDTAQNVNFCSIQPVIEET